MAKFLTDFTIIETTTLSQKYQLITLKAPCDCNLELIAPGQFVQIKIDNAKNGEAFLRRPISIHNVDLKQNTLQLLVCRVGAATNSLCDTQVGSTINMMWPLGNGFTIPEDTTQSVLLIGGGVGVAPLLYLGKILKSKGFEPEFLLAARSESDLLRIDNFSECGKVYISTDDGSAGEKGLITQNSTLATPRDHIYCCGPMPMMKAIARICYEKNIDCEVSLENVMGCGIGACLCCVEKTVKGNRCVCTDGPVFNINQLTW
ncbi:MAG: dihydroorotate dehydrogenase electron transfer subunit [Clostridiales bacterium]|nr:dihydroorotate dehydrogenase electron transfer subunit [Clostridiales bacterium]